MILKCLQHCFWQWEKFPFEDTLASSILRKDPAEERMRIVRSFSFPHSGVWQKLEGFCAIQLICQELHDLCLKKQLSAYRPPSVPFLFRALGYRSILVFCSISVFSTIFFCNYPTNHHFNHPSRSWHQFFTLFVWPISHKVKLQDQWNGLDLFS